MICDWSGAALDYAFGLNKPVIFIDVPRKVNNPDYQELGVECFEVWIRDHIGVVSSSSNIIECIHKLKPLQITETYYYKNANLNGAKALLKIVEDPYEK